MTYIVLGKDRPGDIAINACEFSDLVSALKFLGSLDLIHRNEARLFQCQEVAYDVRVEVRQ